VTQNGKTVTVLECSRGVHPPHVGGVVAIVTQRYNLIITSYCNVFSQEHILMATCLQCGKAITLVPGKRVRLYCSTRCRVRHHRGRPTTDQDQYARLHELFPTGDTAHERERLRRLRRTLDHEIKFYAKHDVQRIITFNSRLLDRYGERNSLSAYQIMRILWELAGHDSW